jgi:hypothetical protein
MMSHPYINIDDYYCIYYCTLFIKHITGMHSIILSDPFQMLCANHITHGRPPLGLSMQVFFF